MNPSAQSQVVAKHLERQAAAANSMTGSRTQQSQDDRTAGGSMYDDDERSVQTRARTYDPQDELEGDEALEAENQRLIEELQNIKVKTLFKMVEEVHVEHGARVTHQRLVWLTNKQALLMDKTSIPNFLQAFKIPSPPRLVIFVRGSELTSAELDNGGKEFITRTKFGVPVKGLWIRKKRGGEDDGRTHYGSLAASHYTQMDQRTLNTDELENEELYPLNEHNAHRELYPGARIFFPMAGEEREQASQAKPIGKLLNSQVLYWGENNTVTLLMDAQTPSESVDTQRKAIAPTQSDREQIERRIALFVNEVLMPIVIENDALVVCPGVTNCSLSVAIGKQFAAYQHQMGQTESGVFDPSEKGGPRLLGIVETPAIAASLRVRGTNAHAVVKKYERRANKYPEEPPIEYAVASKSSFLNEQYHEFLVKAQGDEHAFMHYDLVDGITDMVMIDCRDQNTGWLDYSAHGYFENTMAQAFSGEVPSVTLQVAKPNDDDMGSLLDLVKRKSPILFLDTRKRMGAFEDQEETQWDAEEFLSAKFNDYNVNGMSKSGEVRPGSQSSNRPGSSSSQGSNRPGSSGSSRGGTPSSPNRRGPDPFGDEEEKGPGAIDEGDEDDDWNDVDDLQGAILQFGEHNKRMWERGTTEEHISATIAFFDTQIRTAARREAGDGAHNAAVGGGLLSCCKRKEAPKKVHTVGQLHLNEKPLWAAIDKLDGDRKRELRMSSQMNAGSIELQVNMPVEVKFKGGEQAYAGKIMKKNRDDTFDVMYDHGDIEKRVQRENINPIDPVHSKLLVYRAKYKAFITQIDSVIRASRYLKRLIHEYLDREGKRSKSGKVPEDRVSSYVKDVLARAKEDGLRMFGGGRPFWLTVKQLLQQAEEEGDADDEEIYSETWLQLYELLKESWDSYVSKKLDSYDAKGHHVVFSGSIFDLASVKSQMESRLTKFDRIPDTNTLEELIVLRDAWDDVDVYLHVSQSAKLRAKSSFISILVLGVGISSVVVLEKTNNWPQRQLKFSAETMILFLAILLGMATCFVSFLSPVQKWQQLKSAALLLQSEIWQFRTRTGPYSNVHGKAHVSLKTQGAVAGRTIAEPKDELRNALNHVRDTILSTGGIKETSFFTAYKDKTLYQHLQYPPTAQKWCDSYPPIAFIMGLLWPCITAVLCCTGFRVSPIFGNQQRRAHLANFDYDARGDQGIDMHHSPLEPDAYVYFRLDASMSFYQRRLPKYSLSKTTCTLLLLGSTFVTAGLADLHNNGRVDAIWITVVTIFGTSITCWNEFSNYGKKLARYSGAVNALRDVKLWWQSLSPVEKGNPKIVNLLVAATEEVMNGESKAWLASSQASKRVLSEAVSQGTTGEANGAAHSSFE